MDFDINLILVPALLVFLLVWLVDKFALKQRATLKEHERAVDAAQAELERSQTKLQEALAKSPSAESDLVQEARRQNHLATAHLAQLQGNPPKDTALVRWSYEFLPVLAVIVVVRSFLIEPFNIPSSSMVTTLHTGDFVLVDKTAYGLRLPLLHTKILETGEPARGDVAVFRYPENEKVYFIKRVIGLPGDKISFENGSLHINGQAVSTTPTEHQMPQHLIDYLEPDVIRKMNASGEIEQIQLSHEDRVRLGSEQEKAAYYFNETLGEHTYKVRYLVSDSEPDISARLMSQDEAWSVTVPEGHYFVMGDNRDKSDDSRYWGFVPEANLSGKATYVWMHKKPGLKLPSFDRVGKID